jgi:YkoY family integral membrane protein
MMDFFHSQTFTSGDLAVVLLLTILEGLLSIDNALVLGLLAKRLPRSEQGSALNIGLILAVVFRFVAIFMASLLLRWTIVKLIGGGYLAYIAVRHLFFESKDEEMEQIKLDEHGHPIILEPSGEELTPSEQEEEIRERMPVYVKPTGRGTAKSSNYWLTVGSIGLTDIAFAVDSILAAIALVGAAPPTGYHPKLWVVILGGGLGILLLRIAAGLFIKLLERFPRFEISAYLLVLVIGCKLLADWGFNSDASWYSPAFEKTRESWAERYEGWLMRSWIFKIEPEKHGEHEAKPTSEKPAVGKPQEEFQAAQPARTDADAANPPPGDKQAADHGAETADGKPPVKHATHLLDFHNLKRPECMGFWMLMALCFLVGFLPPRKKPHSEKK